MNYNWVYRGRSESSNIIGYVEESGSYVYIYLGKPGDRHIVGRLDKDGILSSGNPENGWKRTGLIDSQGYVYSCWNPDTYHYPDPRTSPDCIGKYENGLFYSSQRPAFGSGTTFNGTADSCFVGTTERADSASRAAALILLLGGEEEYEPEETGGETGGSVPLDHGGRVTLAILMIGVIMLLTIIFLKAAGLILAAMEFLVFVLYYCHRKGRKYQPGKIRGKDIGAFLGSAGLSILVGGILDIIIRDKSSNDIHFIIGGLIFGFAGFLYDRFR